MIKGIILGMVAFALSFFVAGSVVHGQTPTVSPVPTTMTTTTPTPTTTSGTTVPAAAPATGFGQ